MAMPPKVSVVLSAFNPRFLNLAVDSILNQTFTEFEFVIIDDSIASETKAILDSYTSQDQRIKLIRNEHNQGQTRSLNKGLSLAQAPYIARQDDDDISYPDRLLRQVEFLDTHPQIGLLGTQADVITGDGIVIDGRHFFYPEVKSSQVKEQLYIDNCLCHGSVMFRRSLLKSARGYDESLAPADDYDLWLRLSELTDVERLDTHLFQYRYYPDSVSERHNHKQLHFKAVALERALQRRFGPTFGKPWSQALAYHYRRAAVSNFRAGHFDISQTCLARVLILHPELLSPPDAFLPVPTTDEGIAQAEALLAEMPRTLRHQYIAARLKSRLHMQRVFAGLATGNTSQINRHIWTAIRSDPTWLFNRGVVATAIRSLAGRSGFWHPPENPSPPSI